MDDRVKLPVGAKEIAPWEELRRSVVYERFGRALVEVVYGAPFRQETTFSIKREASTVVVVAVTDDKGIVLYASV